ncbi:MAG TPA: hypothetical protein VMB47_15945 [Candidatus Aquilonibacter sp.]|nr:hypothetical protein [Candidatus Aquilonibacter sp.]
MIDMDYEAVLHNTLEKLSNARRAVETLEVEAAKLRQFFFATLNMLPEEKRANYVALLNAATADRDAQNVSLKEAIVGVLRAAQPKYLTVAQVRDRLNDVKFDFNSYASNPLASISTTLKRMQGKEATVADIDGVTAYRWIERFPRTAHAPKRNRAISLKNL